MPTYRGNLGNLLQHWVLNEILKASEPHARSIEFVDAHSMAPIARERHAPDLTSWMFDAVRGHLPGQRSTYEKTWFELEPSLDGGYPNSAVFLTKTWPNPWNLVLCEKDQETADELSSWRERMKGDSRNNGVEIYQGDWRERFSRSLPRSGGLLFISFDPYKFDRDGSGQAYSIGGNMYPERSGDSQVRRSSNRSTCNRTTLNLQHTQWEMLNRS